MRNQTYTTRHMNQVTYFSRNRNAVRHTSEKLGLNSLFLIVFLIIVLFGVVYVAESAKATSYDYEISAVEAEISEKTVEKEDLAVEKARLTSIATAKSSTVATMMEDATVTGYVAD